LVIGGQHYAPRPQPGRRASHEAPRVPGQSLLIHGWERKWKSDLLVSVITGGGVLAYLAMWAIIPEQGQRTSITESMASTKQDASAGW